MKNSLKLWETIFVICVISSLIVFDLFHLTFLPLLAIGIIPSILALKEGKHIIITINILTPILLLIAYFILW
ncbi:hypothetical protein [Zhenhengia yiwuensis]|uniref:hypothetical protein n=1 Tax=Zhenhengia yiwuensis TaxID=2763666 RepID=UPI002A75BD2C|nr:hypothetical protein [Zhenhengia yiwuensis]MDY3367107.1 hypothetical protein [Zhenhengia yiwuensis]